VGRISAHYIARLIYTCFCAYTIQARSTTNGKIRREIQNPQMFETAIYLRMSSVRNLDPESTKYRKLSPCWVKICKEQNNRWRSIDLFRIVPKWSLNGVTHRGLVPARPWKDHFKSDLRSDQDHRQKNDLRSDQEDHLFWKSDLDLRSFKKIISKKLPLTFLTLKQTKMWLFLHFHVVYLLFWQMFVSI
jgi:hypothetical protein